MRPFARERYTAAYSKIQVGDDKQLVLQTFGKPEEITDCYFFNYSPADENLKARCAEEYWYRAFIEQWVFVFDKNGKVISKGHDISY